MSRVYPNTVLRGLVVCPEEVGVSHDLCGDMDGNPDRTNFTIKVLNGPDEVFCEWLLTLDECSIVRYGDTMRFAQIGAAPWPIYEGAVIELGFDQYFNARIDFLERFAKGEVNTACFWAQKRIEAITLDLPN